MDAMTPVLGSAAQLLYFGVVAAITFAFYKTVKSLVTVFVRRKCGPLKSLAHEPSHVLGRVMLMAQENFRIRELTERNRAIARGVRGSYGFLGAPSICVSDPKWVKRVLGEGPTVYKQHDLRGSHQEHFRGLFGATSILLIDGPDHKRLRKKALPALKRWTDQPEQLNSGAAIVDIKKEFSDLMLELIVDIAMGTHLGLMQKEATDGSSCPFASSLYYLTTFNYFSAYPYFVPAYDYVVSGFRRFADAIPETLSSKLPAQIQAYIKAHRCATIVRNFVRALAKSHNEFVQSDLKETSHDQTSPNLLKIICESRAHGEISQIEQEDLAIAVILTGYETTTLALTWLFLLFAEHPDCQQRCRKEIVETFGDDLPVLHHDSVDEFHDGQLISDKIGRLAYTQACINEALRLYPPVSTMIPRVAQQEDLIEGCKAPVGTDMNVCIYEMHHDPELWPEPYSFKPDRFLENPKLAATEFGFMPFGDGAHKCIGAHLAMTEMLTIVSVLLSRFEFEGVRSESGIVNEALRQPRNFFTLQPYPEPKLAARENWKH